MIELDAVTKSYTQGRRLVQAVRGVTLSISGGEFVTVMGPSGSGKSTLMHLMGALYSPTTGSIRVQGADLASLSDRERALVRREKIGFIFQAFNLLPTLTAVENVALPLLLGRASRSDAEMIGKQPVGVEQLGRFAAEQRHSADLGGIVGRNDLMVDDRKVDDFAERVPDFAGAVVEPEHPHLLGRQVAVHSGERQDSLAELDAQLLTAPIRYSQPMLVDQLNYLYGMLTGADQKVSRDAIARHAELRAQLEAHAATFARLVPGA